MIFLFNLLWIKPIFSLKLYISSLFINIRIYITIRSPLSKNNSIISNFFLNYFFQKYVIEFLNRLDPFNKFFFYGFFIKRRVANPFLIILVTVAFIPLNLILSFSKLYLFSFLKLLIVWIKKFEFKAFFNLYFFLLIW